MEQSCTKYKFHKSYVCLGGKRCSSAILSEKSAPISLQLFEDHALCCAGKLDSHACGEDALELQPSPFDWNDTVGFVV
jgi:hypothetical protein